MFLFKISKEGKSAILFGTVHLCNWQFVPEPIKQIILSANAFVGEHDYLPDNFLEKYHLTKQDSTKNNFSQHLGVECKTKIVSAVNNYLNEKNLNIDIKSLTNKGLMFVSNVISYFNGIDNVIHRNFKQAGKKIFFLENADELYTEFLKQPDDLSILTSLGNIITAEKVAQLDAKDLEGLKKLDSLSWYYLHEQIFKSTLDDLSKEQNKWIFEDRNLKWLPVIEKYVNDYQNAIICIGIGHLFSPKGLIKLLIEQEFLFEKYDNQGNLTDFTLSDLEKIESESICYEIKHQFSQDKFNQLSYERKQFVKTWAHDQNDAELLDIIINYEAEQKAEQVELVD